MEQQAITGGELFISMDGVRELFKHSTDPDAKQRYRQILSKLCKHRVEQLKAKNTFKADIPVEIRCITRYRKRP